MIAQRGKSRNKEFQCPLLRGIADFVRRLGFQNPYRKKSPHFFLFHIGWLHARYTQCDEDDISFNDLKEFSDQVLRTSGFEVHSRIPQRDGIPIKPQSSPKTAKPP